MLLGIEGMFLLISANDLFIIYIAVELQSIALYILTSLKRYSNISVEAGLKYFIYGSFASGMLLYGISLVYSSFGTTNLTNIYFLLYSLAIDLDNLPLSLVYGYILIIAGLFFKLGLAPFHLWVADVYEGAPSIITYFLAVLPKISILFIFYRIFGFVLNYQIRIIEYSEFFQFLFICSAVFSIFIGSLELYIKQKSNVY
jgi:NADH:ubiquinone oxidoreductase subunit 2 (subunit N)